MKKFLNIFIILVFSILVFCQCGTSRRVIKDNESEYVTVGYGESVDRTVARTLAYQDCYQQMANKINTSVDVIARTNANQSSKYSGSGKKRDKVSTSTTMTNTTESNVLINGADYEISEKQKRGKWQITIRMILPRDKADELISQ